MERELSFRADLYGGTAPYYDCYRPPYPDALFDDLCQRLPVSGAGRLLDLACGTGQMALPLARRFTEVWAVDQELGMVAYGRDKAEAAGVTNIRWVAASAETVTLAGRFELVAVGNAFHRFHRAVVAERVHSWLQPGGGLALVWGGLPWEGVEAWQRAVTALLKGWVAKVGATDRVPSGWQQVMDRHPHEQVLLEAGFEYVGKFEFVVEQAWTVETLTGFVYSTSFLNRDVLGDRATAFERDLAEVLQSHVLDGVFHESTRYAYQLARKA